MDACWESQSVGCDRPPTLLETMGGWKSTTTVQIWQPTAGPFTHNHWANNPLRKKLQYEREKKHYIWKKILNLVLMNRRVK